MTTTLIHRVHSDVAATPVNAYLVEGEAGLIAVDATLTVSGGRAMRERADALGKPLLAAVLTHTHPDHYGGFAALLDGLDVPLHATRAVDDAVRRDDDSKEAILRPMFGDEWAAARRFPDTLVEDGETIRFGGVALTVTDLGPGESPADSVWALADEPQRVFSADVAYNRTHAYLADGHHAHWLENIARVREALPAGATLHPGHGDPMGLEALDFQAAYIEAFVAAVQDADFDDPDAGRGRVAARMRELLPTEDLAFLMELSIDPLRAVAAA